VARLSVIGAWITLADDARLARAIPFGPVCAECRDLLVPAPELMSFFIQQRLCGLFDRFRSAGHRETSGADQRLSPAKQGIAAAHYRAFTYQGGPV